MKHECAVHHELDSAIAVTLQALLHDDHNVCEEYGLQRCSAHDELRTHASCMKL